MKISELTIPNIAYCLNLEEGEINQTRLEMAIDSALGQILSESGLTAAEADNYPELTTAYIALIQDAYDNVGMQSDGKGISQVKDCILGLHRRNLI